MQRCGQVLAGDRTAVKVIDLAESLEPLAASESVRVLVHATHQRKDNNGHLSSIDAGRKM
jgi:hypothetical protein